MNIWIVLKDLKAKLPDKKDFESLLKDEYISDEDYEHALKVWKESVMKNILILTFCCKQMSLKSLEICA